MGILVLLHDIPPGVGIGLKNIGFIRVSYKINDISFSIFD